MTNAFPFAADPNLILTLLVLALLLLGMGRLWQWAHVLRAALARPSAAQAEQVLALCPSHLMLDASQSAQLVRSVRVFLAHKRFISCAGAVLDDRCRLAAAVPACLLWLDRGRRVPYPSIKYLHIYPAEFVPRSTLAQTEDTASARRAFWRGSRAVMALAYSSRSGVMLDFNGGRNASLLKDDADKARCAPAFRSPGAFASWAYRRAHWLPASWWSGSAQRSHQAFAAVAEALFDPDVNIAERDAEQTQALQRLLGLTAHTNEAMPA